MSRVDDIVSSFPPGQQPGDREPSRTARWPERVRPLCAGDLRSIVAGLDRLNYPDDCPVEVKTPLNPDRRAVGIYVHDYTYPPPPIEGAQ